MKTLKNYTLLFDAECPLCITYSNALVKTGMLDTNGRQAYQQMDNQTCSLIDKDRARNEIALINTQTGEVNYGIDSLFKVLASNYPLLKQLFTFAPLRWILKKLYFFISYNRKVIIPGTVHDNCVPDFNIKYRWAYILFTWISTSLILTHYSGHLTPLLPLSKFFREFIICGGQIVFQAVIITLIAKQKVLHYIGNMMTISFGASLLLALFMSFGQLIGITNPLVYVGYFMLVVGLMLWEHVRRMKLIGLPWIASLSWVIYRVIVLILILK